MKDFDISDWDEVCKNIHQITPFKNPELFEQIKQYYQINEMSFTIKRYKSYCGAVAVQVHFTIANICCLGNNVGNDCVNHWRTELIGYFNKIITAPVDSNVKREKIVFSEIIDPYINSKSYTYESSHMWEQAMNDEIRKGNKNITPAQKYITLYIKNNILPNIDNIINKCNDNISILFHDLIDACKSGDISEFTNNLDTFINNVTSYEFY